MKLLLVISAIVVICKAIQIDYQQCTYKDVAPTATIRSIDISPLPADGCNHNRGNVKNVCHFNWDTTYNITITFRVAETSTTAISQAVAHIGATGGDPVGVDPFDACRGSVKCPIMAGMDITYKASVHIPFHKSGIIGVGEWRVVGDHDKAIICFVFPFQIT